MATERGSKENDKSKNVPMVLFASNDQQRRETVNWLLRQAGYKVTICTNGAEAVGLACQHNFSVVVIDLDLPVIDGRETAKIVRSHGNNQDTFIIAIINDADADGWIELFETFDDYIDKTAIKKNLLEKINECVQETQELGTVRKSSEIVCKIAAEEDYQRVIERMVCELPQCVAKMKETFDKSNLQEVQFQIRALKEQAVSAGFEQWAEKVTDIEKILHTEEIEKINKKLNELVQMCVKTKLRRQADNE